jgi:hypothetical protein
MSTHSAFFYGTLMAPQVLYRVIYGSPRPEMWQKELTTIQPAMLRGYQRHRVKGADYPAIIPCADVDACVRGTYVTGLMDGDVWRLDIFEGAEYERQKVKVKVLNEGKSGQFNESVEEQEVQTYVWIAGEQWLDMGEWDFDDFVRDKIHRWTGESGEKEYEGMRASVSCILIVSPFHVWETCLARISMLCTI